MGTKRKRGDSDRFSEDTPDVEQAMAVRSMRLPENLWRRLTETLTDVNRGRPRPVTMSSLIRILLEDRLEQPERPIPFGKGILRPSLNREPTQVQRREVHKGTPEAALKARPDMVSADTPERNSIFDRFKLLIAEKRITSNAFVSKFLERFPGDRRTLVEFYYSGQTPAGQAGSDLLTYVAGWMDGATGEG